MINKKKNIEQLSYFCFFENNGVESSIDSENNLFRRYIDFQIRRAMDVYWITVNRREIET